MTYIEKDCCIEHEGKKFCAGGAVVTEEFIIAYPTDDGILTDWHGSKIGTWREVGRWRINSYMGSHMLQIEARVNGVLYTGRGFGVSCIYRGRRKKL